MVGSKSDEGVIMASKRKRHLQYQAKKGRLQVAEDSTVEAIEGNPSQEASAVASDSITKKDVKKSTKKVGTPAVVSKLPDSETRYIKKELVYLLFIALLLATLYLVIWLIFKYTQIDESLYSLIKLGGK